jgi:hypothetical protein
VKCSPHTYSSSRAVTCRVASGVIPFAPGPVALPGAGRGSGRGSGDPYGEASRYDTGSYPRTRSTCDETVAALRPRSSEPERRGSGGCDLAGGGIGLPAGELSQRLVTQRHDADGVSAPSSTMPHHVRSACVPPHRTSRRKTARQAKVQTRSPACIGLHNAPADITP